MGKNLVASILPGKQQLVCRHCGSTDVRPSHKGAGSSDAVVYRCRTCKRHFKVSTTSKAIPAAVGIGIFLLVAAVVVTGFIFTASPGSSPQAEIETRDHRALDVIEADAKKGNVQAQYDLGLAHWYHGDYPQAMPWLKLAADNGNADAQYLLGVAYLQGNGTVQNYRAAMEQFEKAANRGHLEAEYKLGIFYRDGLATAPDKEKAYIWFNVAAAQGHTDALVMRQKLTMAMTGDQLIHAQEASAQLHKKLNGVDMAHSPN